MEYRVVRSFRRSLSIQVEKDGSILIRAPFFLSDKKIYKLVLEKSDWILKKQRQVKALEKVKISREEEEKLRSFAKEDLLPRLEYWSNKTGLSYSGAKITSAKGRFGSCNQKKKICLSLFLMLADESERDYVVLHELCHTKEMNHSSRFYELVSLYMPDYKVRQKKLKSIVIPEITD